MLFPQQFNQIIGFLKNTQTEQEVFSLDSSFSGELSIIYLLEES